MRHRPIVLLISAVTVISLAGCSKDDAPAAAPRFEPGAAASGAPGAPGASAVAGAPGSSAAPGDPAAPGATNSAEPSKPGDAANGPGGRPAKSADSVSAAGLGPYEIGVPQKELKSAGLLGKVSGGGNCDTGSGDDKYHSPKLTFRDAKLQRLTVTAKSVVTPEGAKVGTSYADVKGMYPAGKQLSDWVGASGWLTTDGDYALLFKIKGGKVAAIEAGEVSPVQFAFTDNQAC